MRQVISGEELGRLRGREGMLSVGVRNWMFTSNEQHKRW